jgi:hypothetical protein
MNERWLYAENCSTALLETNNMASDFTAPVAEEVLRDFSKTLHKNTIPQNEALRK